VKLWASLPLKPSGNQVLSLPFVHSTLEVLLVLTLLQVCHALKKFLKEEFQRIQQSSQKLMEKLFLLPQKREKKKY
jgi:hypothetical protein